ncbi:TRAP transporter small permease subunit [Roseovarius atlanticus]|uniref:TRAP transporter small permease subunit n=1 Tax=Roseovarius atlanticus TaxID=1641875 RepID=UPI001C964BCF|nr:TRAP transporter small permease subunit [Roseovarius atlanticus]MBY5987305.1 TRAP transporter small permease subunit [Roseovarius atlanticus]MBY6125945.1 TRAP transporter small permease subunit [Roseovarius atlanticus]MBY6149595.1 TRAP transporter small permease subunit [Roseovarius atlanticus]
MRYLIWIDRINLLLGRTVSFAVWIGAALLVFEVISRYAFGQPTIWAHGYTQRIFACYFILVGAYTLLKSGHVRVDVFLVNRGPRGRALLDALNYAFLLIWCLALTYEGWNFFQEALLWNEKDDSALAHPLWPVKLCLVVAAGLISLQALAGLIRSLAATANPALAQPGGLANEP